MDVGGHPCGIALIQIVEEGGKGPKICKYISNNIKYNFCIHWVISERIGIMEKTCLISFLPFNPNIKYEYSLGNSKVQAM